MGDPERKDLIELIERKTKQKCSAFYATPKDIENTLALYKNDIQQIVDRLLKEDTGGDGIHDPPVAKIVDSLIESAYYDKASDIHIEPQEKFAIVRYRIDG